MFQDLNPLDKPTAMLEILVMVAGAALIGFFLGWLSSKLQRDKLKADLRFNTDKLSTLQGKADGAIKDQSELKRMVEDLRSRKDALFSELEAQKSETKQLREELKAGPVDGSEKMRSMKAQIDGFDAEKNALLAEIKNLSEMAGDNSLVEQLQTELAAVKQESESAKAQVKELSADTSNLEEIERLKAALASSNEEKLRLKNQVETLSHNTVHRDELNSLEIKIATLEADKTKMEEQLSASSMAAGEGNEEELKSLKEEVHRLEGKYKELEEEYEELEDKLDERPLTPSDPKEVADLRLRIAALESEKQDFQERISSLERLEGAGHQQSTEEAEEQPQEEEAQQQAEPSIMDRPDTSLTYEDFQYRKKTLLANVGTASEADKDNFSKIVGIGPFIEAKLNSIGIFTYEQISRLKENDVDHVTRLIEFFPGRIERDGWVRQAAKLIKKRKEEEEEEEEAS